MQKHKPYPHSTFTVGFFLSVEKIMLRTRTKGVRVNLIPIEGTQEDVKAWMKAQRRLVNYASKVLLKHFKRNPKDFDFVKISDPNIRGTKLQYKVLYQFTEFKDYRKSLGLRDGWNDRTAAIMAGRFYNGYGQRNGRKKEVWEYKLPKLPPVTRQNKALYVACSMLRKTVNGDAVEVTSDVGEQKELNVIFTLRTLNGQEVKFKGLVPSKQAKTATFISTKADTDGNISYSKYGNLTLMLKAKEEYETAYDPVGTIGVDFNRRPSVFATFSDGSIIPSTERLLQQIKLVEDANKRIEAAKNAKLRQSIRYEWKVLRKELMNLLEPLADKVIQNAVGKGLLLCIDGVTQTNTSFGHSEFRAALVKKCDRGNIPYVIVPPSFTSMDCHECSRNGNYSTVGRSSDFEKVYCPTCDKVYHADLNAAKNIALDGWEIFFQGRRGRPNGKTYRPKVKFLDKSLTNF